MRQPIEWQIATIKAIKEETPRVKTFTLTLPRWTPHQAGQHYDVRLTAPDGYQAQRSYSIASEPERHGEIDLTVEVISDGEVSTYLHQGLEVGDQVEVRGPIGGYFIWEANMGGPIFLIAGGSGVVPLMAMIRHRAAKKSDVQTCLLYSVREPSDVIYEKDLKRMAMDDPGFSLYLTYTRKVPDGWNGYERRIDLAMLREVSEPLGSSFRAYICGPTLLVENVATLLAQSGITRENIRTERFGPTGGS